LQGYTPAEHSIVDHSIAVFVGQSAIVVAVLLTQRVDVGVAVRAAIDGCVEVAAGS
jgi:hypothetical protein